MVSSSKSGKMHNIIMTYLIADIASEQDYSNELKELNSLKIDTKRQEVVLLKIGFKIIQSFQVLSKQ